MLTDIVMEDGRWRGVDLATLAESAANAVLGHLALDPDGYEIALLACDDARIALLNAEFRGKPAPTNVLSWPAFDLAAPDEGSDPAPAPQGDPDMPESLGDIAIAWDICMREAEESGKTLPDHVSHLVVHGVLHLLGYDHIRDGDATIMEHHETAILGKMGIDDPYREQ